MLSNRMVRSLLLSILIISYVPIAHAADTHLYIEGVPAKKIYESMTGPAVANEGAAGHLYRTGKSIFCRYTNADMADHNGHNLPANDSKRYTCTIKFNQDGLALPGKNP